MILRGLPENFPAPDVRERSEQLITGIFAKTMSKKINLKSLSRDEIAGFMEGQGLPKYRAEQLLCWIYDRHATSLEEITEFSKGLRNRLGEIAYIGGLEIVRKERSSDGTEKFLFALEDGQTVESVLIPDKDRLTLCISSQVGCAMGCRFCLTGKLGMIRNLRAWEIVDQILSVNRLIMPKKVTNIVLMGMGEPLANFDEVVDALKRVISFIGISKRKITLSTAGLVPKIRELPAKAPDVNLAISLNATTDEVRDKIMPINKKYPIRSLIEACRRYPLKPMRRITFEYVLIGGVNDSPEDARRLVRLLRGIRCKINLIPINPLEESDLQRPSKAGILVFQKILTDNNMTALIRESRGQDILAACGQLRGRYTGKQNISGGKERNGCSIDERICR
ncbi:MAG: rRNA ((2503)-C(2))-methyltransferase RlmN [Nitrospirae bacterium]|nr:rRNA ((2503)-C(2))-methyltransferase RlmN [Nitrospirota bacterium]